MDDHGDVDQNEHQKLMDGFGAQIGSIDRKLDTLRNRLIAAEDVATVDKISEERAAIKKQKDALEKLHSSGSTLEALANVYQEELADYHRTRLKLRTKNSPPAVKQKPRLIVTFRSSEQEAIDLTQDDIPAAIKRERSVSPNASGPASKRPRTRRGPQQVSEQDAQQVTRDPPMPETRRATSATSNTPIDARTISDFSPIADSHPTLVPSPDGVGAVELRCPDCKCNAAHHGKMNGGQQRFFTGAVGFQRHVRQAHGSQRFNNKTMPTAAAIRECTWARVSQEVVDAIKSGDTNANVVPVVVVDRRAAPRVESVRARRCGRHWSKR
ncbi:hypothetical protein KC332_g398 [Hortaea werneckii]|nr:hypothetical protein KC358_g483 [Hortaea werneckii]KAI6852462.1 hypothetical protein KC350_g855 [Hortaea werneckii]KAI6944710.1 hypothetical protein KC341_g615 [Hortaea werneckii]KAI6950761.1 hypothetical protein KC348_g457 [Hortaea werneckii]KAI6982767.1 hypothetical protein KC321_g441 [Hortaea werneckii]